MTPEIKAALERFENYAPDSPYENDPDFGWLALLNGFARDGATLAAALRDAQAREEKLERELADLREADAWRDQVVQAARNVVAADGVDENRLAVAVARLADAIDGLAAASRSPDGEEQGDG